MDTSNLTLASPVTLKMSSGSSAPVTAPDATQNTKPVAPRPADSSVVADKQPLSGGSTETTGNDQAQSQNETQSLVQDTLRKLNDLVQTSIAFSQHEETGRTVITVSDKKTGEEIRTIPSEDFLAIAAHLQEVLDSADGLQPGLLVSSRA